jgi:hypothetical protein
MKLPFTQREDALLRAHGIIWYRGIHRVARAGFMDTTGCVSAAKSRNGAPAKIIPDRRDGRTRAGSSDGMRKRAASFASAVRGQRSSNSLKG